MIAGKRLPEILFWWDKWTITIKLTTPWDVLTIPCAFHF
jgi:hypothetical protein